MKTLNGNESEGTISRSNKLDKYILKGNVIYFKTMSNLQRQ